MKAKNRYMFFFLAVFAIFILYFILRLFNILNLPIFTDEAIYVRWAQIAKQDASWRFISLVDGKQPGYVWAAMVLMKFIKDPLLAGRLVSVLAGLGTTVGLFFLGNEVFRVREKEYKIFEFTNNSVAIGLLSSFFYVIYPFGLLYDRMALYDSLVGAFAVWSLYILIVLVRSLRLDAALIAGIAVGAGMLTKTNALFSLYSIPILIFLIPRKKNIKDNIVKFFLLSLVVVVVSNVMYAVLRLSPFYHIIEEKNALFFYPLSEWVTHPFTYFSGNLSALLNWFFIYFSIVPIIFVILSFLIKKEYFFEKAVLVLWFLFPFVTLAFFGHTIYPRFILFMTLPLIPLAAYSILTLAEKYRIPAFKAGIILLAFVFYIYADYFILFNFDRAPIPRADLGQYVNDWTAGNGVKQSVDFFRTQALNNKIYIVTEGTFGLMPYGLEMYLVDDPNIKIHALWPIADTPPKEVALSAKKMPVYAIFYQPCPSCGGPGNIPPLWHGRLINTYRQGISESFYSVYQIFP